MEITGGFKLTEIGIIPVEWGIRSLNSIADVRDGTHESPKFYDRGVPFVTSRNIINGKLDLKNVTYISEKDALAFNKRSKVNIGDILMSMIGTIGNAVWVDFEPEFCIKNVSLIKPFDIDPGFLIKLMQSPLFQTYLSENLAGGIQKFIALGKIRKLRIPYPPISEQRAIAEVLSDIDALIAAQEALIAKKRAIKQGVMQELLTGKRRLPGFSREWEEKKLGDVLKIKHGRSQNSIIDINGCYPILGTGGEIGKTNIFIYDKPSVLIGRKGTIDTPQYMDSPFWTIDTLFYSEIFGIAFPKYIFYLFNTIDWYAYNEASGVPSLNASTIENIAICLPSLNEQIIICGFVSDIDQEINSIELIRDKTKALKQGMMQELLTGRIRLTGV